MRFWAYSTTPRSCGRCHRTIRSREVALRLRLQSRPDIGIWRCTDCVGPPPADVVAAADAIAIEDEAATAKRSLMDKLEAIARRVSRRRTDWKARQVGDGE